MKKATAAKLDKWFRSHAPSFVALDAPTYRFNFTSRTIPFNDLMRQFHAARLSNNREQAEAILDKLFVAFRVKRPQGKLERDVLIALLYLGEKLNRNPTIPEIFRMVHGWDKSYSEPGVRTAVRRLELEFFISPGKRGRPRKT
jgi:hypothetical protein